MTDQGDNVRQVLGIVLIVLGTLWMALSGLCTLAGLLFTASMASSGPGYGGWSILAFAIVPGAVSIGAGWLVRRAGKWIKPHTRPDAQANEFE